MDKSLRKIHKITFDIGEEKLVNEPNVSRQIGMKIQIMKIIRNGNFNKKQNKNL